MQCRHGNEQGKCPKCRRYEQAMRRLETTKQDVVEGVSNRQHPFRALVREIRQSSQSDLTNEKSVVW